MVPSRFCFIHPAKNKSAAHFRTAFTFGISTGLFFFRFFSGKVIGCVEQRRIQVTISCFIFLKILLMVLLCRVVVAQTAALDHHRLLVVGGKLAQRLADDLLVCRVHIVDAGAVLAAAVLSLPVERGRVDAGKVNLSSLASGSCWASYSTRTVSA